MTRADWGLILVLVAIQFTHMVDFVIIMPLGGRLMGELHISAAQFGWLVSAYALAAGLASVLAGPVMDRFDRKAVLLTMYAGFTVSTLLCGLAPNYELLLASRALAGASGGLAAVTLMAVIGDVFPAEKRGRASGAVVSAFAVASIAGLPAGLILADWYGRGAPFVALAAFSAGVWILAWRQLPAVRGHLVAVPAAEQKARGPAPGAEGPQLWVGRATGQTNHRAGRAAHRSRPLPEFIAVAREASHLWAFAFSFFTVMGTAAVGPFIGPYLMGLNGWSERDLSVIYLIGGVCTLVGMNAVGRLADRVPRRPLFRVLAAGSLVAAVVMANWPRTGLAGAVVAVSVFMVFSAGRVVPAQALLLGVAAPHRRGAFLSLNTAVQHLASGVAPIIAGLLLTRAADGRLEGFPLVGLVAAGTAAVSLVLVGRIRLAAAAPAVPCEPARFTPDADPEPKPAAV